VPEWGAYLKRYSRFGTDSTIKDTLGRRLINLLERELLSKTGAIYSITDTGLAYLNQTGGGEDTDSSDELQQILILVKKQKANVRDSRPLAKVGSRIREKGLSKSKSDL
jgi:restriction system protein